MRTVTIQNWDTSLIGVDSSEHTRQVLVVPGVDMPTPLTELDHLQQWSWTLTTAEADADPAILRELARRHDVALFSDIRGTRAARRALTAILLIVAIVPAHLYGRLFVLLAEVGPHCHTTVFVVRDARDATILRRVGGSALVWSKSSSLPRQWAAILAAVLLRTRAWQPALLWSAA